MDVTSLDIGYAPPRPVESRDSIADRIIAARLRQAEGTVGVGATAAVELAAGLWERAFLSAECPALDAQVRAMMARSLLLRGEFVAFMQPGMPALVVHSWDVHGRGTSPADWRYRLSLPQPDGTRTIVRAAASRVFHPRIGCRIETPWKGRSPLDDARGTRQLLELLESRMADEAGMPVGAIVPVPKPNEDLAADVAGLRGRVLLGETMAGGWERATRRAPTATGKRAGSVPIFRVRTWSCGAPCRVPCCRPRAFRPTLPARAAQASASRGGASCIRRLRPLAWSFRQSLNGSVRRRRARSTGLFASDLQGRARAMGSMVQAGISPASAARICGFEDADIVSSAM